MKRKYFSVLLMGALTMTSVSTLTSCKDYDDDISNLQNQIDQLNELVKKIQGQIEKGAILESVTPTSEGVTIKLSNGNTYNIKNGETGATGAAGQDGKNGTVWKIGENGNWWASTDGVTYTDTGMASKGANGKDGKDGKDGTNGTDGKDGKDGINGTDGKDGKDGINGTDGKDGKDGINGTDGKDGKDGKYYEPRESTGTFWEIDGDKATDTKIAYLAPGTITAVWTKDALELNNVKDATNGKVTISLTTDLKALVFEPDFYYGGIEALDVASYKYKPLTVKAVSADANNENDAPSIAAGYNTDANKYFTYAPEMTASYFLNPSNAKIGTDVKNYKFIAYDKEYATRSVQGTDFTVTSAKEANGKVSVSASYSGEEIKKLTNGKVTVIALQYSDKENTVTSDFAALRNTNYYDLVLNNPKGGTNAHTDGDDHLYTTAAAAIAADPTAKVAFNTTIDLRKCVNTDRMAENETGCKAWDANAAEGKVEKIGFKYKFELVGYEDGHNHTKQSVHAAIASDGYTLRPQMPKDGKQQAYGAGQQNEATIDKEPLVRVSLIDTKNKNQIVAVGYFKVKITSVAESIENPTINMPVKEQGYTLTCGDNAYMTQVLKWNEIEEMILAELHTSKADFHANYALTGSDADATQYNANGAVATKIGVISQTTADVDGTQTQVLKWVVKNVEAYNAFKSGKTAITTWVCYQHNTDAKKKVYLKFEWNTNGVINIKPATSWGDSNKTKSYWYGLNNPVAGTGCNEIHGNVEVVGTSNNLVNGAVTDDANDEFVFNIMNTLVGNKLKATLPSPYTGLNSQLNLKFAFVEGHGLYPNDKGDKVYAERSLTNCVATMDQTKGIVTLNDNAKAKELLNAHGHTTTTELANALTAKVKVVATVCSAGYNVTLTDNEFDIKFIRPITVTNATATFTDAAQSVQNLELTFKDWRKMGFTAADRYPAAADFFKYYGVKKITLDKAKATTDLNGNSSNLLSAVTSKIKLSYIPAAGNGTQIVAGQYGQIKYENLGNTVGTFHITIPGYVTYDWGELPISVTVTVNGTASAKRH